MNETRLAIRKTYKLFIGGNFVRSESGRAQSALDAKGNVLDNICPASRKDLRDAVTAARSAWSGWAKKTAYLRGQIFYRAAEMLENRANALAAEISRSTLAPEKKARTEVALAIDRLVYFAGWTDKVSQVFGGVNPVATPHFNFTVPESTGVVAVVAPDEPSLLGLVGTLAPVILTGNAAVVLCSEKFPLPALTFAEILATSDFPGGVINILCGQRQELLPHLASHMDINAIVNAAPGEEAHQTLQQGTALNLKRYARRNLSAADWADATGENPYWILDTLEYKTAWHPIGL